MRKIVSNDNGFSLFFEDEGKDVDCIAYETGKHMTGQDVATYLNISRSAVSQSLKRSIKRIFYTIKRKNHKASTVQIMCIMADMFNVKSEKQYKKFFKLFPSSIKGEVHEEAFKSGYCRN